MLLLIDLDNTLIDRSAAFRRWSERWAPDHGGSPDDIAWLIATDREGYEPREHFAELISARFAVPADVVLLELRAGMIDQVELDPQVGRALGEAVDAGWSPVVVTNGSVRQQEAKLRRTGLDRLVAGWVISEGAGVRKPERRVFELAAGLVQLPLNGWMIGDDSAADIGGGVAAGLSTIWLPRGRTWPPDLAFRPTRTAADCATAIREVVRA